MCDRYVPGEPTCDEDHGEPISDQPEVGTWKGATTESIALCFKGDGCWHVLRWSGKFIADEIARTGSNLEDVGLGSALIGFSIWEGAYVWNGDEDDQPDPISTFRPLTPDEWQRLATTGTPWEMESSPTTIASSPTTIASSQATLPLHRRSHITNACSPDASSSPPAKSLPQKTYPTLPSGRHHQRPRRSRSLSPMRQRHQCDTRRPTSRCSTRSCRNRSNSRRWSSARSGRCAPTSSAARSRA